MREKFLGRTQNGLFKYHNTTKNPSSWAGFKNKWTHFGLSQGVLLARKKFLGTHQH